SVNVDLVVTVERLPGPGETVTGGSFARHHGGKGGNQAVAAARLGAVTAFVGAVGGDAFGRDTRAALEAELIDLRGLVTLEREATGVALITVETSGENTIAVAGGANVELRPEHVREALGTLQPHAGDVVLVGHEIPTESTREALRLGRAAGATTILNPAPASGLDARLLDLADILTPNRGELAVLSADDSDAAGSAAARLVADAPGRAVLVTLGADGALLVRGDGTIVLHGPPVQVVDTVGAGDTLNGALAAGLAAGMALAEAAQRAVTAATMAVTRAGAREGMPTLAELQAVGG
ncbi:MAG TPA: ribokinase, partial [Candidatus Limnocylindrales bacterium]|nr:ribokinase [Candidatus Limnocylindrales bacterium]